MANFSIVIVPTKKLANGRHRIRIAVAHRSKTRYIPTQFTLDSASQLKNGRVVRHENVNPEKPDVPINKNDAFQKVQKRRVQEKR